MSSQPKPCLTPEQYLALERTAAYKSEYFRGEVFAMLGTHELVTILNDAGRLDIRNKAAHDEVLSRDEAQQARSWAMQILGQV